MEGDEKKNTEMISVVIVTWNAKNVALECLHSLEKQVCSLPVETIVVDNASTDGTQAAILKQFPNVHLIENDSNLGFAKANNIGISCAQGVYVCLINSDVVLPPDCLERMINYMNENPDIGMLGPKMLGPDGSLGQSVMRLPTIWNTFCCALGFHSMFRRSPGLTGFMMTEFNYDTTKDVEVLTGWFWMLRQSALREVGGLDERFFMYGEDIDWSHRFHEAGWRVVFYAGAEALHYGAASSGQAPIRFYLEMQRANLQYFTKYHGRSGGLWFLLISWLHQIVRMSGYGALYCLGGSRRPDAGLKFSRSWSCVKWLASARLKPIYS